MKNRDKTLTSLAAASMVLTQAGQMSVFAKEEPIKNLSDTEAVSVKKTQKEMLEEQIKNTLDNVNEAKRNLMRLKKNMKFTIRMIMLLQFQIGIWHKKII